MNDACVFEYGSCDVDVECEYGDVCVADPSGTTTLNVCTGPPCSTLAECQVIYPYFNACIIPEGSTSGTCSANVMITQIAQTTYATMAIVSLAMLRMKNTVRKQATMSVRNMEGNKTSPVHFVMLEPAFTRFQSACFPLTVPPISVGMANATLVKMIP